MFSERTSVGLDVHARSIVGCGLDTVTGEVFRRRLTPTFDGVSAWLAELPAPVAVAYEAGPTGFGLARQLTGAGVRCVVAAPSKLQRPAGDRVKTDARDALHLARLLRMDQIVAVRVPTRGAGGGPGSGAGPGGRPRGSDAGPAPGVEAAAAAGHRVLRRARRGPASHEVWLRGQRFDLHRAAAGVRHGVRDGAAHRGPPGPAGRGDHRDGRRQRVHPGGAPAVLPAWGVHADRVRRWRWRSATGTGSPAPPSAPSSGWCPPSTPPARQRSQGSITKTGNTHARRLLVEAAWHHRKAYRPGHDHAGPLGPGHRRRPGPAATQGTTGCTTAGSSSPPGRSGRSSRTSPSPASWPAGAGRWPSWTTDRARATEAPGGSAPRTLRGRPSSVKGRCAIAARRPPAALDPGASATPARRRTRAGRGPARWARGARHI